MSATHRCRTCGAFCGGTLPYSTNDHRVHWLRVDERGRYWSEVFDGRRVATYWLDGPKNGDRINDGARRWHERQGHALVPLPDEFEQGLAGLVPYFPKPRLVQS